MRVRLVVVLGVLVAVAATTGSTARAGTMLVVTGHGWGHGVGMSQWGAYGYALHGWNYRRILAHYYPGTRLGHVGEPRVRILLARGVKVATIGCGAPLRVTDGKRLTRRLRPGKYGVGPKLALPVGRNGTGRSFHRIAVFTCARAALTLDGRAYHGNLVVRSDGSRLAVVNVVPLDTYVRGVVPSEMPSHWRYAALEAQAVAARSYGVSEVRRNSWYDLLPDTQDQVYGGVAAEDPRSNRAVYATRGRILTWHGRVARTYYSASSGGRTEAVQQAWSGSSIPYLRSVSDPYDRYSPHHDWGPYAFTPSQLASRLGLPGSIGSVQLRRNTSWRVESARFRLASGSVVARSGEQVARALDLRSTWFAIGELRLWTSRTRVVAGRGVAVAARALNVKGAVLQRRIANGRWSTVAHLRRGPATLRLEPSVNTTFRVRLPGTQGTSVQVAVAPKLRVRVLGRQLLGGTVQPRPTVPVRVWRLERGRWKVVSRPWLDAQGRFRASLRLHPGGYKVTVGADARLTSTQTRLHVTRRLLASLRN